MTEMYKGKYATEDRYTFPRTSVSSYRPVSVFYDILS